MQQPYFFSNYRRQVDEALETLISQHSDDSKLRAAMRYSSLLGGKRLRPILLLASARALGDVDTRTLLTCAVSIEFIHAYSLVHDDLPAMDNDALRRGQPTCHIAYNEATAILVGDALQSLAFELLSAESLALSAETKLRLVNILSRASGAAGMVLGQAIDLESENKQLSLASLENMHRKKTGALIEASVIMGVTAGFNADKHKQLTQQEHQALINYARCIGLAFQVQDDILDIVSDTQTLGKPQGSDEAKNKSTYPALLGLKGASEKLQTLHDEALASLQVLASRNISQLEQICRFIVSRNQ
jgi:geranylgeranyl pyrophosphate synthase